MSESGRPAAARGERVVAGEAAALALACLVALAGCGRPEPARPLSTAPVVRESVPLDGPWRFLGSDDLAGAEAEAFDDSAWPSVTLPHTFSLPDREKQWRAAWYRTRLTVGPGDAGQRLYLGFEGAATVADVWVNGAHLGQHRGAFTAFRFDATPHLRPGQNVVAVRVNSRGEDTGDCLPAGTSPRQLYHVYGGLYRRVHLLRTHALHVDPLDHASTGGYLTARDVTRDGADLEARVLVRNSGGERRRLGVRAVVHDPAGTLLALEGGAEVEAGGTASVLLAGRARKPRLWSLADPHLYAVDVEVLDGQAVVDRVRERFGFRDFRFVKPGFALNGETILLRGTNKHQETERRASAVLEEDLRKDFAALKDLGVNTLRLAHYPHTRLEYDLADELGILVVAENGHSNPSKGEGTGDLITREMVRQNHNHPSIVVWSVGNEVNWFRVDRFAALVRAEDPLRPITYVSNTGSRPKKRDLSFVSHNTYRGWYRGEPWEFEEYARRFRYVAESGGGAVLSNHVDYAKARHVVNAFEPEEYRQLLAEVHCQVVFRDHPQEVPLYLVWVFRDFAVDKYKGWNTKGFLTAAGRPKDHYFLFQSFLRPDHPVVHLTSKTYFLRRGSATNGFKAYSNRPALRLLVNGEDQGERRNGEYRHPNGRRVDNVFFWPAPMRRGRNEVRVSDGAGHEDSVVVYFDGEGGAPAAEGDEPVASLRSSNPRSPAVYVDVPVQDQWPFHAEFDGTADNSFDVVPEALRGAGWVATSRLSKPANRTEISFTLRRDAEVFVMHAPDAGFARALAAAGFAQTGAEGLWRNDEMRLVPYRLARLDGRAGQRVRVPPAVLDYLVLVKPAGGA